MSDLTRFVLNGEQLVLPSDRHLQFSGRIDVSRKEEPCLIYPCSYVTFKFTGRSCKVILENHHGYWRNYVGFILDEKQYQLELPMEGQVCVTLGEGLEDREHSLLLFKRMDACHLLTIYGFILEKEARVRRTEEKSRRRIEVYGDSVSAGEVSEAVSFVGKPDPEHQGEFSNSWYSYTWMAARKLNAEIHNIAQGGIALLDGTGWFHEPDSIGLESTFDKLQYNPDLGEITLWDFNQYLPQVVIIAIGQNDNHPVDYMAKDYTSEQSVNWRRHYKALIENLHKQYPTAVIICTTTILRHDLSWDKAIEEVIQQMNNEKIYHFIYSQNSIGTHGHIRIPEAERMAEELSAFILSLGEEIW